MERNDKICGFTLVELAIALMVIGLLIGGVLKGQELINSAKITRMVKDLTDYDTAVMIFRSTYDDELPGDIIRPTRLPNCNNTPCNQVTNTVGDGKINNSLSANLEPRKFWIHLQRAGLITNINETVSASEWLYMSPKHVFTGHMIVEYQNRGSLGSDIPDISMNWIKPISLNTISFPLSATRSLEEKMDDGKPFSGKIQVTAPNAQGNTGANACYENTGLSYRSENTMNCRVFIALPSLNN